MQKRQSRSTNFVDDDGHPIKPTGEFGELVTMDHKINIEKDEPNPYVSSEHFKGRHLLVVLDVYTQWLQAYPVPTKEHDRVTDSLLQFFGPQYHPDYDGPGAEKCQVRSTPMEPRSTKLP